MTTHPTLSAGDPVHISAVLFRAAELIRQRGHGKHRWQGSHGRLCVEGAIVTAAHELGATRTPELTAATVQPLALVETTIGKPIPRWNDHPDRTAAEVIGVLETTARLTHQPGPSNDRVPRAVEGGR